MVGHSESSDAENGTPDPSCCKMLEVPVCVLRFFPVFVLCINRHGPAHAHMLVYYTM